MCESNYRLTLNLVLVIYKYEEMEEVWIYSVVLGKMRLKENNLVFCCVSVIEKWIFNLFTQ